MPDWKEKFIGLLPQSDDEMQRIFGEMAVFGQARMRVTENGVELIPTPLRCDCGEDNDGRDT